MRITARWLLARFPLPRRMYHVFLPRPFCLSSVPARAQVVIDIPAFSCRTASLAPNFGVNCAPSVSSNCPYCWSAATIDTAVSSHCDIVPVLRNPSPCPSHGTSVVPVPVVFFQTRFTSTCRTRTNDVHVARATQVGHLAGSAHYLIPSVSCNVCHRLTVVFLGLPRLSDFASDPLPRCPIRRDVHPSPPLVACSGVRTGQLVHRCLPSLDTGRSHHFVSP